MKYLQSLGHAFRDFEKWVLELKMLDLLLRETASRGQHLLSSSQQKIFTHKVRDWGESGL